MPLLHLTKAGFLAPAPLGGIRTARVKTAAGRRIFRTGNIALKQNALGLFTDGGDGNGGEQRLRVGEAKRSSERASSTIFPRYMTAMRFDRCFTTLRSCEMNR